MVTQPAALCISVGTPLSQNQSRQRKASSLLWLQQVPDLLPAGAHLIDCQESSPSGSKSWAASWNLVQHLGHFTGPLPVEDALRLTDRCHGNDGALSDRKCLAPLTTGWNAMPEVGPGFLL